MSSESAAVLRDPGFRARLQARCLEDDEFHGRLVADPRAAIEEELSELDGRPVRLPGDEFHFEAPAPLVAEQENDMLIFWEHILRPALKKHVEQAASLRRVVNPPLPFGEVFLDLLATTPALPALKADLLRLLTGISARPLLVAFTVFRESYADFIHRMQTGGLDRFLAEYPELARLIELCVRECEEASREFVTRLEDDREQLPPGPISDLAPSLSDRHYGRSVMAVTFDSGLKMVYKPRDVSLEAAWFGLLGWLNRHSSPVDFRIPRVVARSGYGWMEFVEHRPCRDERETQEHLFAAGALQCLLYVLHATDAHMGNVIAAGPAPVLVDAECLVQPRWRVEDDPDPDAAAINALLLPGILPQPAVMRGEEVDLSALTGVAGQRTNFRVPVWNRLGTDAISLRMAPAELSPQKNSAFDSASFVTGSFERGFREMHRCLAGHKGRLLASGGPLDALFQCRPRVLLEHTRRYLSLLNRSLQPRYLRSHAKRVAFLEGQLSAWRPPEILHAETKALADLNVPYFWSQPGSTALWAEGAIVVADYFAEPGADVVRSRLSTLSQASLERQAALIRILLAMQAAE